MGNRISVIERIEGALKYLDMNVIEQVDFGTSLISLVESSTERFLTVSSIEGKVAVINIS